MRFINFLVVVLVFYACKKEVTEPILTADKPVEKGLLVLCEGLFQQNNASLSWVNTETGIIDNEHFHHKTGRYLGDTGNDMEIYGSKIYIVVNVSSTIEVIDKYTNASLGQINMKNGNQPKSPRQIKFYNGFGYVTCFDGFVDVIDTVTLSVIHRIKVGENPEGITFSNDKMYVSNSGGLNVPNVDSTLSVVDMVSRLEIKKITVGKNPGGIATDSEGEVYVIARGNYGSIPSRMVRVNSQTDEVEAVFPFDASGITVMDDKFLIKNYNFNTQSSNIALFDPLLEVLINTSLINDSQFTTLYGVFYNVSNQKIYCTDAMGYVNTGYVKVFSKEGVYEKSYHVGLNPNNIVFYE